MSQMNLSSSIRILNWIKVAVGVNQLDNLLTKNKKFKVNYKYILLINNLIKVRSKQRRSYDVGRSILICNVCLHDKVKKP